MTQTSELLPEALAGFPVGREIGNIDFDAKVIIALAQTGSGKTMALAPYEHALTGRRVLIRQPTRLATRFVMQGLKHFWGDQFEIGISTRDEKSNLDAPIVVFSDGSLSSLIESEDDVVYFDEAHAVFNVSTEIEMAICKRKGLSTRLLSATIDPAEYVRYFGEGTKTYELSGRSFPIEHKVMDIPSDLYDDQDENLYPWLHDNVIEELLDENERGIVFLPTKEMCNTAVAYVNDEGFMEAHAAHGEVSPIQLERWCEQQPDGEPYVIFATVAAATSITIDLDRVYIFDQGFDSVTREGVTTTSRTRVDDNTLLQMAGRCGRLREGTATLMRRGADIGELQKRDWSKVEPRPVKMPAGRATPFEVILSMAREGYGPDDIDLISDLDQDEIDHAVDWLERTGCITSDCELTGKGKAVARMALPVTLGVMAAHPHDDRDKRAVMASLHAHNHGTYFIPKIRPGTPQYTRSLRQPGFEIIPKACVVRNSLPATLHQVMHGAVKAYEGKRLDEWAKGTNLNTYVLRKIIRELEHTLKAYGWDLSDYANDDPNAVPAKAFEYALRSNPDVRMVGFHYSEWAQVEYQGEYLGCVSDSVAYGAFGNEFISDCQIGLISIRTSKAGNRFATLGWSIRVVN